MESLVRARRLLAELWSECLARGAQLVFIERPDDEPLPRGLLGEFAGNAEVLHFRGSAQDLTPLFPFLGLCSSHVKGQDPRAIARLVQRVDVYRLQRPVIEGYLARGEARRDEELLYDEIEWERKQLTESLSRLLAELYAGRPTLLVLEEADRLPLASLALLTHLVRHPLPVPVLILVAGRRDPDTPDEERERAWSDLVVTLDEVAVSMRLPVDEDTARPPVAPAAAPVPAGEETPALPGMAERLSAIRNAVHFLALADAQALAVDLYHSAYLAPQGRDEEQELELLSLLGDIAYYRRDDDLAVLYSNTILNQARGPERRRAAVEAWRRLALAYNRKGNADAGMKCAREALAAAHECGDDGLVFRALFALFAVDTHDNRLPLDEWKAQFRLFTRLGESLPSPNLLAYWLVRPDRLDAAAERGEIERLQDRAVELARQLGNQQRLGSAWHTRGFTHIVHGAYEDAASCYRQSERCKAEVGDPLELSYLQNGFGYLLHQRGKYAEAERWFFRSFDSTLAARNYLEVGMVYCNIGINYAYARQWDAAVRSLEALLEILDRTRVPCLSYHSRFEVYALLAFCHYKLGKTFRFHEFMDRLEHAPRIIFDKARLQSRTEEDLLALLLAAFQHAAARRFADADAAFRAAEAFVLERWATVKYRAVTVYAEHGLFLAERADLAPETRAAAVAERFRAGLEAAKKLGDDTYAAWFEGKLAGDDPAPPLAPPKRAPDFARATEMTRMELALASLHRKLDEIQFLNGLQLVLANADDEDFLVRKVLELIHHCFEVDTVAYHVRGKDGWELLHLVGPAGLDGAALPGLVAALARRGAKLLLPRAAREAAVRDSGLPFRSLLSLPLPGARGRVAHLLCATTRDGSALSTDDLQVLLVGGRQLLARLDYLAQELELSREKAELKRRHEAMTEELVLARRIQAQMIPAADPWPNVGAWYHPVAQLGGDFYDYVRFRDPDQLGIFVSDASGHGVPAAFLTAMIKAHLLRAPIELLADPAALLDSLNEVLYGQAADHFVTVCYGIYDRRDRSFRWSNAGHPAPVRIGATGPVALEGGSSCPLGVLDKAGLAEAGKSFLVRRVTLETGDRLLLYTDGITEARRLGAADDDPVDFEAACWPAALAAAAEGTAAGLPGRLAERLLAWRGGPEFDDDVCLVCLGVE